MLRAICDNCPNSVDCFENAACIHAYLRVAFDPIADYPPLADFDGQLTEHSDLHLQPIIIPHEDSIAQD